MRIALHDREPYESGRTIWRDVAARGYRMDALVAALVAGDIVNIEAAVERVWERTGVWGAPEGA